MKNLLSEIRPAVVSTLVLAVVCCGLYPLAVTGIAKVAFAKNADGSFAMCFHHVAMRIEGTLADFEALRKLSPEFAAFCSVFLDGSSTFTTGQFIAYAGGWA